MKATMGLFALRMLLLLLLLERVKGFSNLEGVKCGDQRCTAFEYCSRYDQHCKPCSSICDANGSNYEPHECSNDCKEYLRDKRYVLLKQYEDLRGEVGRLWILVAISTTIAVLSLLSSMYLFAKRLARWEKMRGAVARAFTGKWIKKAASSNNRSNNSNNSNNNNNNNERRMQEDAELGTSKHNGLKLVMPTISASVAPRDSERGNGSGSGNRSVSGSGSGSGSGIGTTTPNTTSTSLSRRHPSEDTTLDYAYDNPAMTPSPESVQLRAKRESSF